MLFFCGKKYIAQLISLTTCLLIKNVINDLLKTKKFNIQKRKWNTLKSQTQNK